MFPKSQIQSAVVKFSLRSAEGEAPDAENPEVVALLARLAHGEAPTTGER